jgi:hypothetical protein
MQAALEQWAFENAAAFPGRRFLGGRMDDRFRAAYRLHILVEATRHHRNTETKFAKVTHRAPGAMQRPRGPLQGLV